MITRENLKEVLENLTPSEIFSALYKEGDIFKVELSIFNSGWFATIQSVNYCSLEHAETIANGDIYQDKEEFIKVYEETLKVSILDIYPS